MSRTRLQEQLSKALAGGAPLIYVYSPEEERVMRALSEEAAALGRPLFSWSCVRGLDGAQVPSLDPAAALMSLLDDGRDGIFVFKDLDAHFGNVDVVRALREVFAEGAGHPARSCFIISPELNLPETLKKEFYVLEVTAPDEMEITALLERLKGEGIQVQGDFLKDVILALKGLTESEIRYVMRRISGMNEVTKDQVLDEIFEEKQNVVRKSGFLEFSPPKWGIAGIGGLDNLKEWLTKRAHTFTQEAVDAGVPVPKGLLMMGVSGCGKSLAVKTISSLWNIPLFRLDMNLVFSGMYGTAEEAFHKALKTIEAVAPAVLWIDEIENALGMDESGNRIASHIFSSFLTWMQEKPPLIFIAATANKIQALPAEILRKGRFDEVFFCDLPAPQERLEILKIHLKRNGANPDDFDLKMLQIETDGWNGAEIEQAVISARTEAYFDNRQFTQRDLSAVMGRIVPLSETMEQQIKAIRSWAFSRATPASKYGKSAAKPR